MSKTAALKEKSDKALEKILQLENNGFKKDYPGAENVLKELKASLKAMTSKLEKVSMPRG